MPNHKDVAGQEYIGPTPQPAVNGTQVTVFTPRGQVQGTMIGGIVQPNKY